MTAKRNYGQELKDTADHRYTYSFDLDVTHKYMMRSFEPFWRPGSVLELGSTSSMHLRRRKGAQKFR